MADYARERVDEGHRTIKVKVGNDPARDVEAVERVRAAIGPACELRVDANMAWPTAKEAIRLIRAMERWDLELVEQPLPPRELDAHGGGAPRDRRAADGRRERPHPARRDGGDPPRRRRHRQRLRHRGGRPAEREPDLRALRGGGHAVHDRQHARVRHRHGGADPSRRRHDQPRPRQRHLRRPLSRRGSADPAAADRGRVRVSAEPARASASRSTWTSSSAGAGTPRRARAPDAPRATARPCRRLRSPAT